MDIREEIERIIEEGVDKNLSTEEIIDGILAAGTQSRKRERVSVQEFEDLIRDSKRKIKEVRTLLAKSLAGDV